MSPEELAEARHYAACYQAGYVHDQMHNLLDHIDQQAALIIELEKRNAYLEARLGHEQVATMQDREAQLQEYIRELEKKVEFWSGIAMKYVPRSGPPRHYIKMRRLVDTPTGQRLAAYIVEKR